MVYPEPCQTSNGAFWQSCSRLQGVNYFRKKLHLRCPIGLRIDLCRQQAKKLKKKGANNCNQHKYGFSESRFKEENYLFQTIFLKRTLTKSNYYRRTCFVTRSICAARLVTRSISLTARCTCSTHLLIRTTCLSIRSTCLSILLFIHSPRLPLVVFVFPLGVLVVLSVGLFIIDHNSRNFL